MNHSLHNSKSDSHAPVALPVVQQALQLLFNLPGDTRVDSSMNHVRSSLSAAMHLSFDCSSANIHTLSLAGFRHIRKFVILPSSEEARWLLPDGNARQAIRGLRLYTPFSTRTRILKALGTGAAAATFPGTRYPRVLVASRETLPIENLIRALTGETRPGFAVSIGTPGTSQKLTVQAMSPSAEILAYIKLPFGSEARDRIRAEAAALERLWQFPKMRSRIPRLLHSSSWGANWILVQTPLSGTTGPVLLTPRHEDFLRDLHSCGSMERPGEAIVTETSAVWERLAHGLGSKWQELARDAFRTAGHALAGQRILCAPMHGDFAPWNSRSHAGQLACFDWESAGWKTPIDWDRFHFLAQTKSLINKGPGPEALPETKNGSRASFILYLLNSTAQLAAEGSSPATLTYREQLLRHYLSGNTSVAYTHNSDIESNAAPDLMLGSGDRLGD